jgi:hypothetical protein
MRMYIDEAGEVGMAPGSSPTFSLAAVLFETEEESLKCDEAIERLKKDLHVTEFHFADLDQGPREAFLKAVLDFDFVYVIQTVVEDRLRHPDWKRSAFFYNQVADKMAHGVEYYLRIAQECCLPKPLDGKVVIDRNDNPNFIRAVGEKLRRIKDSKGRSLIGKVTAHRSISLNCLQMADMICGAALKLPKSIQSRQWERLVWP